MAGGQSNFRCFCDNCAEPGHHLSGLWASNRSFGKPRKWIEGDFMPLLYQHYKKFNLRVIQVGSFNQLFKQNTRHCYPQRKALWGGWEWRITRSLLDQWKLYVCFFSSGLLHNAPDFYSVLACALWRMLAADSGEALDCFLVDLQPFSSFLRYFTLDCHMEGGVFALF